MYDFLFHLLDSVPTLPFLLTFLLVYLALHPLMYHLLLRSPTFRVLDYSKKSYILCSIMETLVLVLLSYLGVVALWRGDISFINTSTHAPNVQVLINASTMYTIKDIVETFVNKKIARSTVIHHICVTLAYIYVMRVLHTDYNVEGVFKNFIGYAVFTTLDFPFEIYLALRFFIDRQGLLNLLCKRYVFLHNLTCVTCNFLWQTFYFSSLMISFLASGSGLAFLVSSVIYLVLLLGWGQEEYVVMQYLWNVK